MCGNNEKNVSELEKLNTVLQAELSAIIEPTPEQLPTASEISDELNEIYKAFLPKNLPGIDTAIKTMMKLQKSKVAYLNELVYWQKTLKLKFHKLMILQVLIELNPETFKKFAYTATVNSTEILCYIGFVGFFSIKSSNFFLSVSSQKDEKYKSDFDYIKNDIRSIAKVAPTTNLSTFNQLKDIDVKYSFLAGKAGVGQQANALMDYVLGSLANLSITNFNVPKSNLNLDQEYSQELSQSDLDYYAKELNLSKEQVNTLKSVKISNSLSAILNAFVDIAKDPYITEGNWVTMTTNTGNLLLRKGVHPFYVNAFLAQPVIKEYVEFSEQYESSDNQNISTSDEFIKQKFGKDNYDNTNKTNIFSKSLPNSS
jgi:hypothetical protein